MGLGLEGRVAIVTGSRGIGLACARVMLREDARVGIVSRDSESVRRAVDGLAPRGEIIGERAELSDERQTQAAFTSLCDRFGSPDIDICAAGGAAFHLAEDRDAAAWRDAFEAKFMTVMNTGRWRSGAGSVRKERGLHPATAANATFADKALTGTLGATVEELNLSLNIVPDVMRRIRSAARLRSALSWGWSRRACGWNSLACHAAPGKWRDQRHSTPSSDARWRLRGYLMPSSARMLSCRG